MLLPSFSTVVYNFQNVFLSVTCPKYSGIFWSGNFHLVETIQASSFYEEFNRIFHIDDILMSK
jgi:hypothetical protein